MSFGRPGGLSTFSVAPPDRGSFPLDHDGDCKEAMMGYLKCLKLNAGNNGECRLEAKNYLGCRMDHDLMTRDDFTNLGLGDVGNDHHASLRPSPTTTGLASGSTNPNTNTSTSTSTSTSTNTSNTTTDTSTSTTPTPRI